MKLYLCVEQRRRASGGGAVTCRAGGAQRPWGRRAGPAGRVPDGRGARLPAQPRVSGNSMATRRRRRDSRSRPTFKSKWLKPQAPGGRRNPHSQALPEGCRTHRDPGDGNQRGAPVAGRKGLGRRTGSWGAGGRARRGQGGAGVEITPGRGDPRHVGGEHGDHLTQAYSGWKG